jgi:hypothetical protein
MEDYDSPWRGYQSTCEEDASAPGLFRLKIFPMTPERAADPEGARHRLPRPAEIHVRGGQAPEVVFYSPPEKDTPDRSQADYEGKAVEIVKEKQSESV